MGDRVTIRFVISAMGALFGAASSSSAQNVIDPTGRYSGVDIGLVEIYCQYGERGRGRRRGVLVATATPEADFEVVLTAEHGFPQSDQELRQICFLPLGEETTYPVAAVWRPDRFGGGYSDDWAVLLIRGRLTGAVSRHPLAPVERPDLQAMISNDSAVRLPLRFAPTERPCELTQDRLLRDQVDSGLLAHNCEAWRGHSGSPILIELDGQTFILGLHLGNRWIFETSEALPLGRYVDQRIADAVSAAIEAGRALEPLPEESQASWLQRLFGR
jgi:hypothetical protein